MFKKIFFIVVAFVPTLALANWSYVDKVDDFTDEVVKYTAYTDSDHRIQLSRENNAVWIFITRKKTGTFEPNGIIQMRIDNNKMRETDPKKLKELGKMLGNSTFQWEPDTVGFLVWHGKSEDDGCGFISELLSGEELKVRYQINTMERDSFKVDLKSAKEAITSGLDLKICGMSEKI